MQDDDDIGLKVVAILLAAIIFACVLGVVMLGVVSSGKSPAPVMVNGEIVPQGEPLATIYFESGKSELPDEAGGAIQTIKEKAQTNPKKLILISGFHDPSGDPEKNALLAKARADAVREALIEAGLPEDRVHLRKPEVVPGTEDMQEARRVDIRLQ
ncbi:OmpA family protein [Uliginosibacterium paludis]|uniref:OmpA family protein n=1 Tax=Uliginosibacterium paludis TaxID=1615952 RepID=A0ABV2CLG6_9RHOO